MKVDLNDKIIGGIQEISHQYLIDRIVLFGSRARGNAKKNSDIDLAVFPSPNFNSRGYFSSAMDDLETLLKIDLVFVDEQTDVTLLESIRQEGVLLYERSER